MGGRRTEEEDNGLGWTPLSSFILFQFPESGLVVVSLVIIPSSAFRSIASSGPNPQKRCSGRVALQKHTDPASLFCLWLPLSAVLPSAFPFFPDCVAIGGRADLSPLTHTHTTTASNASALHQKTLSGPVLAVPLRLCLWPLVPVCRVCTLPPAPPSPPFLPTQRYLRDRSGRPLSSLTGLSLTWSRLGSWFSVTPSDELETPRVAFGQTIATIARPWGSSTLSVVDGPRRADDAHSPHHSNQLIIASLARPPR
jgi:hypothetical protein